MTAVAAARVGLALLSSDVRRLAIGVVGALFLGSAAIVFLVVVILKSLLGFGGDSASLGLVSSANGGVAGSLASTIPTEQLVVMQQAAVSSSCGLPWSVLAGVASVESSFGANPGPSSAGAYGYGQFMPGTWPSFGNGVPWRTSDPAQLSLPTSERFDSSNFHHALPAMARYLCSMVASFSVALPADEALKHALFFYNHALSVPYAANDSYVSSVLAVAVRVGAGPAGATNGSIGGHSWRIAFGFKQPYGVAAFNAEIPLHRGIDVVIVGAPNNGRGQMFQAFYPGVVAALTHDPFGGNGIIVWDARNRLYHRYFHNDAVLVSVGQQVGLAAPIGILGATGSEGFPHVHYEVARSINGDAEPPADPGCCLVDPRPFLRGEVPLP